MTLTSSSISPREELLILQKKLFRQNQKIIENSILVQERGFKKYRKEYYKRTSSYDHISTVEELQEALSQADIIFVGDYHTNKQSQRGFLRILKILNESNVEFQIALELIHKKYQKFINQFLKDEISEKTFLEKIHLKRRWYFDLWENFQPIFDFAKYHHLPLYGVESATRGKATLKARDHACAETLYRILKKNPDRKLIVFIGDLHIANEHLPSELHRLFKKGEKKKELLIYQNSERIYWKLAELEMEENAEIVRINENSFCLMNTPPIIWQQSYLNWLEHEEGEIDFADAKHSFLELADRIANFLEIELPSSKDEVEIYTCGDLSFLKRLRDDSYFNKRDIKRIKNQISAGESYYIPKKKIAYLGSLSLNHIAEEVSHFIRHLCAGDEFERDPADAFYANVLHEALGFFGSKIINHKRKCLHDSDFKKLIVYFRDTDRPIPPNRALEVEIAHLVLEHRKRERKKKMITSTEVMSHPHSLFFGATHALGYMLGDRLFYALMAEKITKEEIKAIFYNPFKEKGSSASVYLALLNQVEKIRLPKRV